MHLSSRPRNRPSAASAAKKIRARRDYQALEERRRKAATMFRQGETPAEVARRLEVSRQAATTWFHDWRAGGLKALKATPTGRPPMLSESDLKKVEQALLAGALAHDFNTDLWTLARVAEVIARVSGVEYHPGHVWRVLRAMGWSLQKPTRRALERDEEAIQTWIKETWPEVKRGPSKRAPGSSSTTRADSP
jgi:transposase